MKTIKLTKKNASELVNILRNLIKENNSFVFPDTGFVGQVGLHFRRLIRHTNINPHLLTTIGCVVSIEDRGVRIVNPFNRGFGYADLLLHFGTTIKIIGSSFFFKDEPDDIYQKFHKEIGIPNYYRQMSFSKKSGWALKITGGVPTPINLIPQLQQTHEEKPIDTEIINGMIEDTIMENIHRKCLGL